MDETPVVEAETEERVPNGFHTFFVQEDDIEELKEKTEWKFIIQKSYLNKMYLNRIYHSYQFNT